MADYVAEEYMKNMQNMQRTRLTQTICDVTNSLMNHSRVQKGAYALASTHGFLAGISAAQGEIPGYTVAAFLIALAACYLGLGVTGGAIMREKSAELSNYTEELKGLELTVQKE